MRKYKASHIGKHVYDVIVEVRTVVMHVVPVKAEDDEHARERAQGIVKAGNTKAVGGKIGEVLHSIKAVKTRRAR